MRHKKSILIVLASLMLVVLISSCAFAYTSDRMDFGEVDFGGATVTYITHWDAFAQFREGGSRAGMIDAAKELFNIGEIEVIIGGWGEIHEIMLNRFLSGDSAYDIWRLPHAEFWGLATRGAFYPVDELLPPEYFENLPRITKLRSAELTYQGHQFQFSAGTDDYGHSVFMVVNKDLFEAEGLPDPYELWKNKEWTWDVISNLARRVTRDIDGDGNIDQWGLSDVDPKNLIYSNGGAITRYDENGKVLFTMDEPASIAALRQFHEWMYVDQVMGGDYQMNEFARGQVAMAFMPFYQIGDMTKWEFTHGVLPLPMGPDVDDYVYVPGTADAFYLPANAEQPLELVALDNFLFPIDNYYEDLENSIAARIADRQSYTIFQEAIEKWDAHDYYLNFLGGRWDNSKPYGNVLDEVNQGKSPATATAEVKAAAQAMIDETLDQ